ncbi:MAG: hypothetical protein WC959_04920 [Kiritimatiellales bacterium]
MNFSNNNNFKSTAWLWWIAFISIAVGVAAFFALEPFNYKSNIENIRIALGMVFGICIPGICIIIGTSRKWFD